MYFANLKEECANCEKNPLILMRIGKNRPIGSTNIIKQSSLSHPIPLIVSQGNMARKWVVEKEALLFHLSLVDLAGSENTPEPQMTGESLKEGSFIKSFHARTHLSTQYGGIWQT